MSQIEKAVELYWKYYQLVADCSHPEEKAKECSLIAVKEIIDAGKDVDEFSDSYWLQVKQEIEKI